MDFIRWLITELISVLPFVLLCIAIQLINYKPANRHNQFLLPFVALLYCMVSGFAIKSNGRLVMLITSYIPYIDGLGDHEGVYAVSSIILMLFFAIKVSILYVGSGLNLLIQRVKLSRAEEQAAEEEQESEEQRENVIIRLCKSFIDIFYVPCKSCNGAVLLRNKWTQYKYFYKYIFIGVIIFSVIMLVCCYQLYTRELLAYPVISVNLIIVLGEIFAFLGGLTEVEFVEENGIESINPEPRYAELLPVYTERFGNRIMDSATSKPIESEDEIHKGVDAVINQLLGSSDDDNRLLAKHIKNCIKNGFEPEVNYIKAAARLNKGKSVIFTTPFYNDLNIYIFFSCYRSLLKYKKTLIIVGRGAIEDDIQSWADNGLSDITGVSGLWESFIMNDAADTKDIGILPYYNINNVELIKNNTEFLSQVGFVIIVEPSKILATAQIGLSNIVDKLSSPTYCAIDKLNEGLLDALSHSLRVSIEEVSAEAICRGEVSKALVQADGNSLHYNMFSDTVISRYLGVGTELAAEAVRFGVGHVCWNSYYNFPVLDMSIIDKEYYSVLCQYMDIPVNQSKLEDVINFNVNLWNTQKKRNSFIIAEDEECNMYEVIRQYGTRGDEQSFVAVISPDYILREYMEANSYLFENDSRAIPIIVPDYTRSIHNMVIKLIMALRTAPVKEETIRLQLKLLGEEVPSGVSLVNYINGYIKRYFDDICVYQEQIEENKDNILNRQRVDAIAIDKYDFDLSVLKNTYYIAEDETEDHHYLGGKLFGHIYQMYLPGQFIVLAGKNYEVMSITGKRGMIVRRAESHIDSRRYYRQIRTYSLSDIQISSNVASVKRINGIEIAKMTADIAVRTDGYIELNDYSNIRSSRCVELNLIPERHYKNKSMLVIKFPTVCSATAGGELDPKLCNTLAVMLSEMLRTVFPDNYQYLAVVTPFSYDGDKSEDIELLRAVNYKVEGDTQNNCIYVIEDSEPDLGLIAAFNRNFRRLMGLITDYLMWLCMTKDVVPCNGNIDGMKEVIEFSLDVLANYGLSQSGFSQVVDGLLQSAEDKTTSKQLDGNNIIKAPVREKSDTDRVVCRYMKFGYDSISDIFELDKLYAYMLYFGFADSALVRLRLAKVFKNEGIENEAKQDNTSGSVNGEENTDSEPSVSHENDSYSELTEPVNSDV